MLVLLSVEVVVAVVKGELADCLENDNGLN